MEKFCHVFFCNLCFLDRVKHFLNINICTWTKWHLRLLFIKYSQAIKITMQICFTGKCQILSITLSCLYHASSIREQIIMIVFLERLSMWDMLNFGWSSTNTWQHVHVDWLAACQYTATWWNGKLICYLRVAACTCRLAGCMSAYSDLVKWQVDLLSLCGSMYM